jgi:acyl carrier protein
MHEEQLEQLLSTLVAREAALDPKAIDIHKPFAYYGLDSLAAVTLSGELETALGRRLPATLAWDYPTISHLARHLAGGSVAGGPSV